MKCAAFVLAGLLATPAFAADDPAVAAGGFYGVYQAQHAPGLNNSGGIPDATGRLRYSGVLSARLNKQLSDAAAAQARLGAKVKGAVPPMLEGDIFSSLFEGATGWQVGECQGDDKMARCRIALTHVDAPAKGKPPARPASWNDTLVLAHTPQGWKVDDVIYDAALASGNTGRLSDMLKMVVASNP